MESAGARLKKIRLEKGLSLEEAHKKTKIHLEILKAIEEDAVINLSPVYQKGFLKIYCRFLGLDPRDYLLDDKESREITVKQVSIGSKLDSLRPKLKTKRTLVVILIVVISTVLFYLGRVISFKRNSSRSQKSEITAITKKPKPQQIPKTEKRQVSSKITSPPQSLKIAVGEDVSGIKLGIRAKEDCYLHLRSDGRVVFQGVLKKGKSESWQAKEKIELSVGNAGAVELEANGKIISNLGRKGQMRKNILITKEGLTVGR